MKRVLVALATIIGLAGVASAQLAYVTNSGNNTVSVVDTATNSVAATIPVGWAPVGIVANGTGTRVYVVNCGSLCTLTGGAYYWAVSVIDTSTNTVAAVVPIGVNPTNIAISPNGSFGWCPAFS